MKKVILSLLLLFFLLTPSEMEAAQLRVSLLLGGTPTDKGYNQLCMEGLESAKNRYRRRITVRSFQAQDADALGDSLFDEIAKESDLVIVADQRYMGALRAAVPKFPDVKFALFDGSGGVPGVKSVVFREEEGGFLAGVLAGMLTKRTDLDRINEAGISAVLIGADVPATQRFSYGFRRGALHVDPYAHVLSAAIGDFDDTDRGRELALELHGKGADIIFVAAGRAGLGAIDNAENAGYWVIGVDAEQELYAPHAVLTSVIKNSGVAVYKIIESCMNDEWDTRTLSLGIREAAIALSTWTREAKSKIPVDIRNTLEAIDRDFQLGLLEVK